MERFVAVRCFITCLVLCVGNSVSGAFTFTSTCNRFGRKGVWSNSKKKILPQNPIGTFVTRQTRHGEADIDTGFAVTESEDSKNSDVVPDKYNENDDAERTELDARVLRSLLEENADLATEANVKRLQQLQEKSKGTKKKQSFTEGEGENNTSPYSSTILNLLSDDSINSWRAKAERAMESWGLEIRNRINRDLAVVVAAASAAFDFEALFQKAARALPSSSSFSRQASNKPLRSLAPAGLGSKERNERQRRAFRSSSRKKGEGAKLLSSFGEMTRRMETEGPGRRTQRLLEDAGVAVPMLNQAVLSSSTSAQAYLSSATAPTSSVSTALLPEAVTTVKDDDVEVGYDSVRFNNKAASWDQKNNLPSEKLEKPMTSVEDVLVVDAVVTSTKADAPFFAEIDSTASTAATITTTSETTTTATVQAELVFDDPEVFTTDIDVGVDVDAEMRSAEYSESEISSSSENNSNFAISIVLRVVDVFFFVVEKIFTVVIPEGVKIGLRIYLRIRELDPDYSNANGWVVHPHIQDAKNRY